MLLGCCSTAVAKCHLPVQKLALCYEFSVLVSFFILTGDDKWKFVAEKLGLNQAEISFLDQRYPNPAEALIGFIAEQRFMSVGELYKVLCDCGVPVIADRHL